MSPQIIFKYFDTQLDHTQKEQFIALGDLYHEWNAKINVISRKDIDNLYTHHILHSLAIAKILGPLQDGTTILDMGTGGGLPGIPLAILYPHCHFHLIDRIGKKIRVAQSIAENIGVANISFQHGDIAECRHKYDFVVSRAVMRLDALVPLIRKNINTKSTLKNSLKPGLICLKGEELSDESATVKYPIITFPISDFFFEPFFDTKVVVYVDMSNK